MLKNILPLRIDNKEKFKAILALILVTVTIALYSKALLNGFVNFDDPDYVTENPYVLKGMTIEGVYWAFTAIDYANWHPLTWLTHMLDAQIFGIYPMGHHMTNVLLHGANTFLLFLFLFRTTGASWLSFLVALLFGVHPLHVESVVWIAERKDVLCGFFWMLTLLAYERYSTNRCRVNYLSVLLFFAAALMSKPMAVSLPFVLLLLDYWPLSRTSLRISGNPPHGSGWKHAWTDGILPDKIPLFLLSGASAMLTLIAQDRAGSIKGLEIWSINSVNALAAYGTYLAKMLWPGHLVVLYPYTPQPTWKAMVSGFVVIGVSVLVWRYRARGYLVTGWIWYLITLLPVSGIFRIGEHYIADRYTYIPLIGPFIAISWGIWEIARKNNTGKKVALIAAATVVTFYCIKTWNQIPYWRDSVLLFRHTIRFTSGNWMAYHNLGTALLQRGDTRNGLDCILKSLQINPEYSIAYNSLSIAYGRLGYEDKAIAALREALRLDPGFATARYNLICAYIQKKEKEAALAEYRMLQVSNRQLADKVEPYFR